MEYNWLTSVRGLWFACFSSAVIYL